jgi:hypothetical protein
MPSNAASSSCRASQWRKTSHPLTLAIVVSKASRLSGLIAGIAATMREATGRQGGRAGGCAVRPGPHARRSRRMSQCGGRPWRDVLQDRGQSQGDIAGAPMRAQRRGWLLPHSKVNHLFPSRCPSRQAAAKRFASSPRTMRRGASVHRRQPEFRGRDSEPAARRQHCLVGLRA